MEEEEPGDGKEGEIPHKWRVTQSRVALKDAKRKENIAKQEQRWMELTEGRKGLGASASVGATTSTVTSTVSSTVTSTSESTTTTMATAMVSSTMEGEPTVDLEEAMMSQGDDNDDTYSRKYKTMSEDRTDRGAACARQK